MNQNDQMRDVKNLLQRCVPALIKCEQLALNRRLQVTASNYRQTIEMIEQALNHTPDTIHVNETPKIEHGGDDVLTKAGGVNHIPDVTKMVRLTDNEIRVAFEEGNKRYLENEVPGTLRLQCAYALVDAMIKKNGGQS